LSDTGIGYNRLYDTFDLALALHRITTGKYKQTGRVLITGQNGTGKSKFALNLGYNIAVYNSLKKYGDASHWQEWFNESHIACINPESVQELMKNATMKHGVYLIDDVSIGWSNRKWMSDSNIWLNNILTTHRIYENTLLFTLPAERMLDAQARMLFNYYVEMTGPHFFDQGVNCGKLMEITMHPRDKHDPVHMPFIKDTNNEYRIIAGMLPPEEIEAMYDKVRVTEVDKLREQDISKKEKPQKEESVKDRLFKYLTMSPNMKFPDAQAVIPDIAYQTFRSYKAEFSKYSR